MIKVQPDIRPNLSQYLIPLYNDTIKIDEHFLYIVVDGSGSNFPVGDYQGVIRLYYGSRQEDSSKNFSVPLNVIVIKKAV